ncbi:MAG: CoA transferase [Anaerolineae bacterium]|nr:CoA transferase [Anaerolineae bacterium]
MTPSALNSIRILDFTRVLAGPFCTMLLADFGADVIKVEQPGRGDDTRAWGPPWAGSADLRLSAYYLSVNRNKRSLTLNLKTPEGQALAKALAVQSDVLIENFKVGDMRGYGLDFATLHDEHPGLVYCSITGYGQDGPYAERPGYDYIVQGQSGLMSITGPQDGEPYKVGVAISDVFTGMFAANAIQAALRHRDQTGQGQFIDIALFDSQIAALVNVASNYLVSHTPPERYGNAHPNIVPYETFAAADQPFILTVGNDGQFRRCCAVMGQPQWATDPRFATNPARVQHRDTLIAAMRPIFATRPADHWIAAFLAAGIPAGPINDIPAVFADPQVQARGLVQPVPLADGTSVDLLGPIPRLSATPATIRRAPPTLGQDTDAILCDVLGLDAATIADYRARGIV